MPERTCRADAGWSGRNQLDLAVMVPVRSDRIAERGREGVEIDRCRRSVRRGHDTVVGHDPFTVCHAQARQGCAFQEADAGIEGADQLRVLVGLGRIVNGLADTEKVSTDLFPPATRTAS
jgi:hypothetical protein